VKARLIITLCALLAVAGLAAWGLVSPSRAAPPAAQPSAHPSVQAVTASPRSSPRPATSPGPATGLRLVFDQQFPGQKLDTSVWGTCYPWLDVPTGCTNFGNSEYEWYLPAQDRVSGGVLHLVAQRKPTAGKTRAGGPKEYACRSGMVTSYPGFRFKYGYVQFTARIPAGAGLWSGLWLAAANLKWPPEIDLLEHWGAPSNLAGVYFHPIHGSGAKTHLSAAKTASLTSGWHTFSVSWTYRRVIWYVDGQTIMVVRTSVPHQQMYLVANLADFSLPKSGGCSGRLLIRSVKVWQK
jgi:beta-glucanase (GH16 family)